ncbi:MAG: 50S ribosomal protein L30 [Calditrichia bacterium]
MAKKKQEKSLKITQVRSIIGRKSDQKRTMEALGLRRMNQTVVQKDNPQTRGMVFKVKHLVHVEEVG